MLLCAISKTGEVKSQMLTLLSYMQLDNLKF